MRERAETKETEQMAVGQVEHDQQWARMTRAEYRIGEAEAWSSDGEVQGVSFGRKGMRGNRR